MKARDSGMCTMYVRFYRYYRLSCVKSFYPVINSTLGTYMFKSVRLVTLRTLNCTVKRPQCRLTWLLWASTGDFFSGSSDDTPCPHYMYQCEGEGRCIMFSQICDSFKDCSLGQDEGLLCGKLQTCFYFQEHVAQQALCCICYMQSHFHDSVTAQQCQANACGNDTRVQCRPMPGNDFFCFCPDGLLFNNSSCEGYVSFFAKYFSAV